MSSARSADSDGISLETDVVITFILQQPGMLRRLLTQHVADGSGHCTVCSSAGAHHVWPCRIRGYANLAVRAKKRQSAERAQKRRRKDVASAT
jgi:hypothetical protein